MRKVLSKNEEEALCQNSQNDLIQELRTELQKTKIVSKNIKKLREIQMLLENSDPEDELCLRLIKELQREWEQNKVSKSDEEFFTYIACSLVKVYEKGFKERICLGKRQKQFYWKKFVKNTIKKQI